MTNLAQAIKRAHQLNEQKLTAGIPLPQLESPTALLLDPWNRYCAFHGVNNLGSPRLVAAFIKAEAKLGTDPHKIALTVAAISDLNEAHGLSNPCATRTVREALGGGEYSPNSDGDAAQRTSADDFQFTASSRDIYNDVMENDRPGGFDTTRKIVVGVNKKQ